MDKIDDERRRVDYILAWTLRMARRYGSKVYDKSGRWWDWGQALCRECYGEDWNKVLAQQGIVSPSWEDIERAKQWEAGSIPDWVKEVEDGQQA